MKPQVIVSVLDSLSPGKEAALSAALSLAHWYDAALHVVHVQPFGDGSVAAAHGAREMALLRLRDLENRIADVAGAAVAGVRVVPAVLSGSPVGTITDYATRVAADLVVVGKAARRGSGYWAAGSFAAALGKSVPPPTIVLSEANPAPAESAAVFRNILVPIDFSDVSLRALSHALVLGQQSGGHVRLLHVLDGFPYETVYSGSRALRLMRDFGARVALVNRDLKALIPPDALHWSEIDVATVSGAPHDAIAAAAAERRADLIVLGLPRRTRMEELVAGSTVHRVLRRTTSPVLLVPGTAAASGFRERVDHDARFALA